MRWSAFNVAPRRSGATRVGAPTPSPVRTVRILTAKLKYYSTGDINFDLETFILIQICYLKRVYNIFS
jgi:hypothetical protein